MCRPFITEHMRCAGQITDSLVKFSVVATHLLCLYISIGVYELHHRHHVSVYMNYITIYSYE
jgi:hypothetical protein|eukprot:COSAG01_NODE_7325_length_3250_cov_128.583624_6_plen_62_part_00